MDTCISGTQRRRDSHRSYDYKSAAVSDQPGSEREQPFDERNHSKVSFSVLSRRVGLFFFLIWVVLGERLAVVGENCLQEGEVLDEPIHRKRVLDGSA